MYLIPVPALADNYLWLLHDGKHALVVKPGDAGLVMETCSAHGPKLESILVTRHQPGGARLLAIGKRAALPDHLIVRRLVVPPRAFRSTCMFPTRIEPIITNLQPPTLQRRQQC